jgi:hypothetical protein
MYEDPRKYDPSHLRAIVQEIIKLRGIYHITDEAKAYFDQWYNDICPKLEKRANNTGAEGRIHTNVLKLAMVLAASEYRTLEIDINILDKAIEKCLSLFVNYKRLTLGQGKSKDADTKLLFLKVMWEAKDYTLSRREVVSRLCFDMSSEELDSIERNLMEGGLIKIDENKSGKKYSLTQESVDYFSQEN